VSSSEISFHDPTSGFNDLKPVYSNFELNLHWSIITGTLASLLLIVLLLKRRHKVKIHTERPRDYYAELESIKRGHLAGSSDARQLASELSLLLRAFVQSKRSFPAVELTRFELKRELERNSQIPPEEKELIVQVVTQCEQIAFRDKGSDDLVPCFEGVRTILDLATATSQAGTR
jgi:hypothetical protein